MKTSIYILLVLLFLSSCQEIKPVEAPDDLIDRATMESIIYDIAVVNSARGHNVQRLSQNGVSPEKYIFEKYKIDSLQFNSSTLYYASDLERYKEMYAAVEKRLVAEHTYYDSITKEEKRVKDSIRTATAQKIRKKKDSLKNKEKKDTVPVNPDSIINVIEPVIDSVQ